MSHYYTRWCDTHGEWDQDIDRPGDECPDCTAAGTAPSQLQAKELESLRERLTSTQLELTHAANTCAEQQRRAENAEAALVENEARLAEAERDAARYREVWNSWPLTFGEMLQNGYGVYPISNKAQGDAAIDAAMEQSQ